MRMYPWMTVLLAAYAIASGAQTFPDIVVHIAIPQLAAGRPT